MVMRPYQITATERILNRIEIANNYKKYGSVEGGGYIWHTTGSGKTLTSFKTARLASKLPYIDKVLFVVDRKDLDYQTMKEYDRFEKGAANSNTSTTILKRQLEDPDAHIIITTIQKLATFIKKNPGHEVYRILRNIICLDLQEHQSSLLILAEPRIQNSLLQVRPLEISFTVIRLWMLLTIKMFFHSGLIILKRWMWRKKSQMRWSGTLTVKRL